MENTAEFRFTREQVEALIGKSITDKQWSRLAEELVFSLGSVFNEEAIYLWEDFVSIEE